MLEAL